MSKIPQIWPSLETTQKKCLKLGLMDTATSILQHAYNSGTATERIASVALEIILSLLQTDGTNQV